MSELTMTSRTLGENEILGLRQEWVSGEDEANGVTFTLDSGAGLGNPAMSVRVEFIDKVTGEKRKVTEVVNIAEVARQWVDKIVTDA